jgi:hypothetical protein
MHTAFFICYILELPNIWAHCADTDIPMFVQPCKPFWSSYKTLINIKKIVEKLLAYFPKVGLYDLHAVCVSTNPPPPPH